MTVAIGSDHAGLELKKKIKVFLEQKKIQALFEKEPYVIGTKLLKNGCIIYVEQNRKIKKIMKTLSQQKEKVFSLEIMEPTLEEAFVDIVGEEGVTLGKAG